MFLKNLLIGSSFLLLPVLLFANESEDNFHKAMSEGKFSGQIRPRIEIADQEEFDKEAQAYTVRAAFQYQTKQWKGFQFTSELESVTSLFGENYNSVVNSKTEYPIIADPSGGHFNKLYLSYNVKEEDSSLRASYGRDEIIYDNWRWVGNVGWRQNHQTFHSTKIDGKIGKFTYHAAWVEQQFSILQYAAKDANDLKDTYFINAGYKTSFGQISGYRYSIEFEGTDSRVDTNGFFLDGGTENILYRLEYAQQLAENQNNGDDANVTYHHYRLGLKFSDLKIWVSQELLGTDDGNYATQSAFGTNHKFNGFADKFLTTPDQGLIDNYASIVYKLDDGKILLAYHEFTPDNDETFSKFGTEWNFVYSKKLSERTTFLVKYADYQGEDDAPTAQQSDLRRLFTQISYKL